MNMSWTDLINFDRQACIYALVWNSYSAKKLLKDLPKQAAAGMIALLNPLYLVGGLFYLQKNHNFRKSMIRAEETGRRLAGLIMGDTFKNKSITLVGFSLGTRVIMRCLFSLSEMGCNKIHDVVLLGGASPPTEDIWSQCR